MDTSVRPIVGVKSDGSAWAWGCGEFVKCRLYVLPFFKKKFVVTNRRARGTPNPLKMDDDGRDCVVEVHSGSLSGRMVYWTLTGLSFESHFVSRSSPLTGLRYTTTSSESVS